MSWVVDYYRSAPGKKMVMAVTGLLLFAYVMAHMLGNLQIYVPEVRTADGTVHAAGYYLNRYAHFLHSTDAFPLLWGARIVLLAAAFLHILAAVQLTLQSWNARPVKYRKQRFREADYAARTMIWSGPIIGLFLLVHLLHLTTGSLPGVPFTDLMAYENVVRGFRVAWISGLYILAVVLLGFHFWHGLWSWFQTLGWWATPAYTRWRRCIATVLTLVVVVGDISIPLAVLAGLVGGNVP